MGGKALVYECRRCKNVRPIRTGSGLCYTCHWHHVILPRIEINKSQVDRLDPEYEHRRLQRTGVRQAVIELYSSWTDESTPESLERQELAAWAVIEAVEDLLGKE